MSGASEGAALRVAVIGADPLARSGLVALLASAPDLVVTAEASPADELSAMVATTRPQVAAWDLGAERASAAEGIEWLVRLRVPVLALARDEEAAAAAFASGARGLLPRATQAMRLGSAVRAVAAGLLVCDEALVAALRGPMHSGAGAAAESLTARELEVLQLLAQGLSNKEIGARLGISDHTAKFHVNSILGKLGAQGRTEAVVRAARMGLVAL